jgi:hypothetical protein
MLLDGCVISVYIVQVLTPSIGVIDVISIVVRIRAFENSNNMFSLQDTPTDQNNNGYNGQGDAIERISEEQLKEPSNDKHSGKGKDGDPLKTEFTISALC